MANELTFDSGFSISLPFTLQNPAAAATTAMVGASAAAVSGYVVPTGYKFHPMLIMASSNADLTAGTAIFKVSDNGTVIAGGPEATLSDPTQRAAAVQRPGAAPIIAGHVVGVSIVTDAGYLPVTADHDAILCGVLLPA